MAFCRFALPNANAVPYFLILIFQKLTHSNTRLRQISGKRLPLFFGKNGKTLASGKQTVITTGTPFAALPLQNRGRQFFGVINQGYRRAAEEDRP